MVRDAPSERATGRGACGVPNKHREAPSVYSTGAVDRQPSAPSLSSFPSLIPPARTARRTPARCHYEVHLYCRCSCCPACCRCERSVPDQHPVSSLDSSPVLPLLANNVA